MKKGFTGHLVLTGLFLILILFLCTGCTVLNPPKNTEGSSALSRNPSAGVPPLYYDFDDVLVPGELKVNNENSFVFKSAGLAAGVLDLNGKVKTNSLVTFFDNNMIKDNWEIVCSIKTTHTLLLFRKDTKWCAITIIDNKFSTSVKIWLAPAAM